MLYEGAAPAITSPFRLQPRHRRSRQERTQGKHDVRSAGSALEAELARFAGAKDSVSKSLVITESDRSASTILLPEEY